MDPFVAEIRIFPFNFPPKGWAFCDGQLMAISQNTALFSLLGTMYGGDGKSTFALPDLQGSVPLCNGQSTTGTQYFLGEQSGVEAVTLLTTEMPIHTHTMSMSVRPADSLDPGTLALGTGNSAYAPPSNLGQMAFQALPPAGGSLPHNNMMPYLTANYCIALQGVFPQRP
jgi:microcystin-dependent protein